MNLIRSLLNEAPTYQWHYRDDERFKTLSSLIKNNGVWKSAKQREFMTNPKGLLGGDFHDNGNQRRDYDFLKNNFNVDINKHEFAIFISGSVQWAAGKKAHQNFGWVFVMDDFGVVRKYKLGWKIHGESSFTIDKKKTKLEWERPLSIDSSKLEAEEKELKKAKDKKEEIKKSIADKSEFVGEIGKWIDNVSVKIEKIINLGSGDYGERYMTIVVDDDGHNYNYFGYPNGIEVGENAKMRAKVKKHYINKNGIKITVIGYPKFKKQ